VAVRRKHPRRAVVDAILYVVRTGCAWRQLPADFPPWRLLDRATTILATALHIVRKPTDQRGFAVIPRRWAVERTFAWLTAHRRLARDYERHPAHSEAMIRWVAIDTITRRVARGSSATRQQKRVFTPSTRSSQTRSEGQTMRNRVCFVVPPQPFHPGSSRSG
jgi:transposase